MTSHDPVAIAKVAEEIYARRLRAELEASHRGEFLAIEPESGDYFLGESISDAANRARSMHPEKTAYVLRIGFAGAVHLGASGA
jgi:hypothetical protein